MASDPFDVAALEREGFAFFGQPIAPALCAKLAAEFDGSTGAGQRHLIDHPAVIGLINEASIAKAILAAIGDRPFAFKATLFDKSSDTNWLVAWHQDVSIPVARREEADGWSGWSTKGGVNYVQPPEQVIRRIVALRLNIDDCLENDGPLRVLPRSHQLGRLKNEGIASHVSSFQERLITGPKGAAMLMSPLLIHASSRTRGANRRRVLHLEFANFALPGKLDWHRQVPCSILRGDTAA